MRRPPAPPPSPCTMPRPRSVLAHRGNSRLLGLFGFLGFLTLAACGRDAPGPLAPVRPPASLGVQAAGTSTYDCTTRQTQLPVAECNALVALYQQTGGPGWTYSTDWLQTSTPCGWYRVSCNGSATNPLVARIDLFRNNLTGSIPAALGSLTSLQILSLDDNQLTGAIPAALGSLASLRTLDLSENQLTGSIPATLGSLANLQVLFLYDNQLTGRIPAALGSLANLQLLYLLNNQLTGAIPAALGSLANVSDLDLSHNQLTGSIPAALGSLTNLQNLHLQDNQLTGPIPAALGSLGNLRLLLVSFNRLTGLVPVAVARVMGLADNRYYCFASNNAGLRMGGGPKYRAADLNHDGVICQLPLSGG